MAWWDAAAAAVGSGTGLISDAVDNVVESLTEVAEEVTQTGTELAIEGLDAQRDGATAVSSVLGAVANQFLLDLFAVKQVWRFM
jgi:flagellin-like hook-associated protein FlgL